MRIVSSPEEPRVADPPQQPGPATDTVSAALDAVCSAHLETYEQLMQGFSYLQPGDVTQAAAAPAQPAPDNMMTTFQRVLSLLPAQPHSQITDCEEEDLEPDVVVSNTNTTASEELEEEVLDEGVCISRMDAVNSVAGSLVKFDNFVGFEASGDGSGEESDEERDPDADEDDSLTYSSSYTASFASAATANSQPDNAPSAAQAKNPKSTAGNNSQDPISKSKDRKNKKQKNLSNEKTKLLASGSVATGSQGASGIRQDAQSSVLSREVEEIAVILGRSSLQRGPDDDLLDMVAASGSEADWFVEEDTDTPPEGSEWAAEGGGMEAATTSQGQAMSHDGDKKETLGLRAPHDGPETSTPSQQQQVPQESVGAPFLTSIHSEAAPAKHPHPGSAQWAENTDGSHGQEGSEQCRVSNGSLLPESDESAYDPALDEANPGETVEQEDISCPPPTQRCLPFSSRGSLTQTEEVTEAASQGSDEVEPFQLDEHFDYDNVQLTPKFSAADMCRLQGLVGGMPQESNSNSPEDG